MEEDPEGKRKSKTNPSEQPSAPGRRRFLKYAVAAVVSGVVAGAGTWALTPPPAAAPPTTVTHTVTTTPTVTATATVTKTVTAAPTPTPIPGVIPPGPERDIDTWGLYSIPEINYYTTAHSGWYYNVEENLNRYTEKTGTKINIATDDFVTFYRKLSAAMAAGIYTYDVVYEWGAWLQELLEFFTPLDELGIEISEEVDKDVIPYVKNTVWYNGRWYALPRMYEVFILNVNLDQLEGAGLSLPTSFEEWVEQLELLKKTYKGIEGYYPLACGFMQGYLFTHYLAWLHCNNGDFWKPDARRTINCDSPESVRAVEDMKYLYDNFMNPAAIEWIFSVQAGKEFFLERATYCLYYPHVSTIVLPKFHGLGYPVSKKRVTTSILPAHKPLRSASENAPEGYGIPRTAPDKRASWDLIKFLHSRETQVQMTLHMGPLPELEEPFPTRWSHYFDERFKEEPWKSMILTQLEQSKYRCSRYIRPAYQPIVDIIEAQITNALKGMKTAEQAMSDAAEATEPLVDREYETFGGGYWDPWPEWGAEQIGTIDKIIKWLKEE